MSTSLVSARLRISQSILAVIVLLVLSCAGALAQQVGSHPPQIWLSEPQGLTVNHVSAVAAPLRSAPSRAMAASGVADLAGGAATGPVNLGQPLSMASADFDEDGVSDLVVGYKGAQGASIVIHRGNLDAFAPQSDASFQAIGRGEFPSPFVTDAQVIGVPLSPDFVATGNFAGNGHIDIVIASRGGTQLYLLPGDGKGNFGAAQTLNLPAGITAMASGEFGRSNGYDTLLVAISSSPRAAALAVIRGTPQGLSSAAALPLNAPATAFAFGDLDSDGAPDAAILAGGQALVLHSSSLILEDTHLPGAAVGLTVGAFIFDRVPGLQIALLMPNGSVLIGAHNDFDPRTYTSDEFAAIRKATLEGVSHPLRPDLFYRSNGWKTVETIPGAATFSASQPPVLFRTRISSQGGDDVMVLNSSTGQMTLISHPDVALGSSTFLPAQITSRPYGSSVLNALPVRVNIDGRPGIVALHDGEVVPSVLMPLPDPVFTVNTTSDILTTGTNFCAIGTPNKCSIRQALWEANQAIGTDTINIPAGTYTLTIAKVANDCTGKFGALYVNDSVNIVGAGQATTIIQAGTTNANGVDMVMAVNEDLGTASCPITNATASISNLTLKFGHNNGTHGNDGDGGCMEFDTGSSGNANLTLTNTTLTDCSTTKGNGSGIAIFNFTAPANGLVTFSNSIVQNNTAVDTTAGVGAGGGGIWVSQNSRMSMTASQVLNNNATQVNGTGKGIGGGIFTFTNTPNSRQTVIHSSTISGNKSAGFGGGIFNSVNLLIDQGTVISGNTAGTDGTNPIAAQQGGGLYDNTTSNGCPGACTDTATLNKVTITGNTATGPGGGIYHGNNTGSGSLTMNFSRLAGNTASSGTNLFEDHSVANVTNNWWGTNLPANTIVNSSGTVNSDPFIVLTHNATPSKIRINQSTTLTGDMSKDNHGSGAALTGNLDEIVGLPITFNNAVLGTIPQAQPETLNASAQATATFNAGGTSGRGTANATVDQGVIGANSNFIASATEAGTTATITTVGAHNFSANNTVVISGVGVSGYNGTFTILATPTPTTFTYTAGTAGLGASSGGTANMGIIILEPPQITKSFGAATIPINGTTTVSFSINNPNVVAINSSFTDTLPTGLQVAATPGVTNTCGGTVTATAGSGTISFSNNLTPIGVCTITVNITGTVDNNYTNTVSILSTDAGNGVNPSSANITVINPPHIAKAFGAVTIPLNGTTSLTFTIDSNGNQNLTQTGVAFTDNLPAGLVVATPGNPTTTCAGGTVTAANGSSTVTLAGASVPPVSSCTVSVTVQGTTAGVKNNSVTVTSTNAGTGNTASATVTVVAPPTISKAFGAASIPLNGTTTVTFTISNPNATVDLSGVAFSDTLPSTTGTLVVATPNGAANTCGGTVTATAGTGVISLSGASVTRNTSCTLSVNVTGTAAGDANNTTGAITSTEGGTGTTSNTALLKIVAPPTISKAFGAANIPLNGTTTVTFTITNPAANTTSETGIAFSDTLTNGLQVASTPGVSNTCGGTVTAAANSTSISLTGGSIATPGNTCTITVNVTGTQAGTVTNTTGAISSTNGGTGATSNTANLIVVAPATVTKTFGATKIPLNGTTSLTINITNPNSTISLTGLSFTDSLPAGLVVATPNGLTNTCGGTATATAGSGSISLSGGTVAASASCAVSVNVQGTTAGTKNNSVTVSSTEGGASTAATATLTVVAPPTISKAFGAGSIPLNGTTTVTFTISNPNNPATPANGDLTGVSFSDTLPVSGGPGSATLVISGTPNVTNTCGGTVTATAGTGVISLSGGSVAHNSSCTISVDVKGTVEGDANNTTGAVSSTEGGTGTTSNTALLKVVAPPTISKAFGAANISLNGTTTVTFTITNPASNTSAENGIAFSDTLTNGLQVASTPGVSNTCGGTVTAAASSTSISLTGGSIATPGSTCTIVVNVTGTQSGTVSNTTGAISSTNGGTGATSNTATLVVAAPATVTKTFGATKIPLNGTTSLTITITNPNTNVTLTGLSFTDSLPAGLVVATPNGLTNTCGGTATATAGSGSVSLSGGTVAASASCAVSVNVQGTTAGTKNNSVTVSSTEGGASTAATATLTVVAPPTISKAFGAGSIPLNGTTTVTFTISNPNNPATPANGDLTGVSFSDTLPVSGGPGSATLVISGTPNVTNTCGGTVTATAGTGVISLSGGSVAHNSSCTISVDVKGTVEGDANNTTGAISSTEGGTGTTSNTALLKVVAPPTISKAFGAASISLNGTTTVTFTITNPASNTSAENGIAFSDTLTGGLQVASTPGVSNTCGGTVTAAASSTSISLTGGSIATPGSTCTIVVNVTGTQSGTVSNTTGAVSSTNGGTGATSNTATLVVASPATVTKVFGATTIPLNGTTSLTITITNPNTNVTLTGLSFTDSLPAGLVVATPNGLTNTCGGTATATAGSGSVSLSGGTVAASASCAVSVNVQGTTAGTKNNSVTVSSTEGGASTAATATLTVVAPPTISKAFGAGSVPLNGTTTVTFTISNPNNPATPANGDLTGVSFSDTLPVSGGPGSATLVISGTPNVTNTCGGTVTATAGTGVISLSGGSVAHNSSCTISVDVKGTVEGDANNTTGAISSTEGGTGTTSNTALLKVVAPPTISKAFGAANISLNGTTTVTFTITNPASNTSAENGIAFSDTLTNGLQVASTPGVSNTCGGTVTAAASSTSISLTGGSIATPGSTCTIVVNVTGTQSGTVSNTTGAVSSTNGGTGATSNTATLVVASPPTITKVFGAASIPLNGTTSLTFNISNPNTNVTLTGIAFTDSLPAGLVIASTPNLSNTCGGTATATGGSGTVSLSGATLAANASCTVSVDVQGTTAGVKNNSVQVTSTEGGTGNISNASITVVGPPVIIKAFGAASIPLNGSTSLSFTIQNNNTTVALSGVAFSDTLPAGLVVSTPNGLTGSCGTGTITATQGTNVISLTGGTIAASSSCTFSVNVTGTAAGTQNNTTGNVTSTEGGTGGTASASVNVEAPPSIAKVFNPNTISLNATTSLTFTITNPAGNADPLTGVAFTDTLPTGLTVANSTSTVCGGTLTTTAPTGISLSGATINTNSQCQFSVTVTGAASGQYTNTTGNVTSTNGGTGNTASANLTVASPPTITKLFGAAEIPLNGTTSLTFNISNPNTNVTLTGVAFTDNLPAGLVVASTPNLSNTCGGTATATGGSGTVSLSGATLATTASCTVSVDVQGATAGVKNNSVQVTSTEGGTGNISNASITVVGPPVIIKAFGAASIPLNGSTSLSFTIQNNNTTVALTGVAFSDTLPAGLVVSTPNGLTGSCGAGTITATQGTNVISLTGGTIAASSSCTFSVNVTGTAAGLKNNTTGNVTSTEGGTGGTASASVTVEAPPSIAKVFNPNTIALNATTSLTFTITNPAGNVDPLTGVAFTDTLPTGLTVANSTSTVCGGTLTTTAPTGISLSGATIAANSQCQFSVTVTGAASGQYTNTTGNVTSTNGGTGNTASANLSVATPPTITKAFGAASILLNASTSLTFNISNPNTTQSLTGVAFTDALPSGLVVATPSGLTSSCGGTTTAAAGSGSVSLSGGTLAANGSCTISLNVTGVQPGVQNNTTGPISATESGAGATSNTASITVIGPPSIAKAFGAASINLNAQTTLTFTITNPNATVALTGVAFGDTLPGGLTIANPNGLTGSCGAGTITTGTISGFSVVNLSGGTIAAGGSCTFSINVVGTTGGHKVNTTGTVTSSNAGSGNQATATIDVLAPDPTITKTHTGNFSRGQTGATYTITVSNVGFGPTVGTVTVTDTLPNVQHTLVPTAMSGTGWTCNLGTLTCTRSDALPSGSSYPPITLTVDVPINIQANVTNTATVSGGGDVNPNNNTANDPTHIGPPLQITPANTSDLAVFIGGTGSMTFQVDSSAGLGFVTFGCSGLPAGFSCSFNPPSENQLSTQVTMTVIDGRRHANATPFSVNGDTPRYAAMLLPLFGLLWLTLTGKTRKQARLRLALCLAGLLTVLAFAGCGGTSGTVQTPPVTFPLTVTATTATDQATTSVNVRVQ